MAAGWRGSRGPQNNVDYRYASYYLVKKANNVSGVTLCIRNRHDAPSQKEKYSPVLNSYATLWNEYKEASSSITLLNVTRQYSNTTSFNSAAMPARPGKPSQAQERINLVNWIVTSSG